MKTLEAVKSIKACQAEELVTFEARVLRTWQSGEARMCLVGDESALTRVDLGSVEVEPGSSYRFERLIVKEYPGGWHSVAMAPGSALTRLGRSVPVSQDEAYIERTFKILRGVQSAKARRQERMERLSAGGG